MGLKREPWFVRVVRDVLRIVFGALIATAAIAASMSPPKYPSPAVDISLRASLGVLAAMVTIAVLRELVPRPHPGAHRVGYDWKYLRWLSSTSLVGVALHPVVRFPVWQLYVTRVLYLKLLYAKVAWSVGIDEHFIVREPSLLTIGPGTQIEPGVVVEAATHGAGRVRIAPVTIGEGCLIGAHTIVMPGATIGHEARIEPATLIGEDVRIGVGAIVSEGARIERRVEIGSYAKIGAGAILSEGVRVGDRARVVAGSVVARQTEIGEREIWGGSPAQPVRAVLPT